VVRHGTAGIPGKLDPAHGEKAVSLITTCPACATSFRVTPQQLSAHRGDVCCGQCQHTFNALKHLAEVPSPVSLAQTPPADTVAPAFDDTVILPQSLDFELEFPAADDLENTRQPTPEVPDSITPEQQLPAGAGLSAPPEPKSSTWRLILLALLLILTALGQSAYFMRTEIASRFPPARPILEQACRWLGCTVELPRHEKLLVIEDSDLQDDPGHEGVLVLVSIINNLAPYAQAYPLLELTLTDTFDKPVMRRTFTPQEYLSRDIVIAQGIAAAGESHVRLNLGVAGTKPSGYRLIIKY
jgi:predicted Zn finger-like uncharacterized protein